ncbi:LytTR family DNA-binding domain-containing protein [Fulvivirga maritima]|uniref:LytR/AlgR family response regulator transcription factor n=1 Tax=Fulvivirga maritima TaxID=2904247 RepID=UPI001F306F97|nr:LytTR family DNA-binding domain-containing protein [Fulvivirga maritima]UII25864.1 LytTR family DNA-binding domain-containing protein [Fulvivirga maritima]
MNTLKVSIIEDNFEELEHLKSLLNKCTLVNFEVKNEINSLKGAVEYFNSEPDIDLAFLDIQLPDGTSFDLFKQFDLSTPVIFTSSYDHYVLQAIKVNGLDYLVKPVIEKELDGAIQNFLKLRQKSKKYELDEIRAIVSSFVPKAYKSSFLVNYKSKMLLIDVNEVAYCYVKEKGTFLVTHSDQEYLVDYYLDQLEEELDPSQFYRVNRQFLMSRSAIKEIENYFNGRLFISVAPAVEEAITVSKKKVSHFKKWADS